MIRIPASPRGRLCLLAAALLLSCLLLLVCFPPPALQELPSLSEISDRIRPSHDNHGLPDNVLPEADVAQYCANYRLEPFDESRRGQRKVYDLLLVNTELEMLELRLGQMSPHVDYFVIIESDKTFTDHPKPLHVRENWARFAPWHDKMILRTMDLNALGGGGALTWDRERASRNAMFTQGIPGLAGPQAARLDDVLLVSDVDEIPKPAALKALRNCAIPARTSLHSDFYYYSFQWLSREDWGHPQATTYQGAGATVLPDDLRGNAGELRLRHAAWHCSYCFGSIREMVGKVTSFSHTELDKAEFKDPEKILQRVRSGKDL